VLETYVGGLPLTSYVQDNFISPPARLPMHLHVQVFRTSMKIIEVIISYGEILPITQYSTFTANYKAVFCPIRGQFIMVICG